MSIATHNVEVSCPEAFASLPKGTRLREACSPVPQGTVETAFHPKDETIRP